MQRRRPCFITECNRRAQGKRISIVNHHLSLRTRDQAGVGVAPRRGHLPEVGWAVILDEAHAMEEWPEVFGVS